MKGTARKYRGNKILRLLFILPAALFVYHSSFGQDTATHYNPNWTKYFLIEEDTLSAIDTTVDRFHFYHPGDHQFGYMHTGNLGAATAPMFLKWNEDVGFDLGFHAFDSYWRSDDAIKYYDTKRPYTALSYQQGSRNEIQIGGIHTQNLSPNFSAGVDFHRNLSDGFYQREQAKATNLDLFVHAHVPNNRYEVFTSFILNNIVVQENGGTQSDGVFSDAQLFTSSLATVRLDSALNQWYGTEIFIQQRLHFGKKEEEWSKKDSAMDEVIVPAVTITHTFTWQKNKYTFYDDSTDWSYYADFNTSNLSDALKIKDTIAYNRFGNELQLRIRSNAKLKAAFTGNFSFHHDLYEMHFSDGDQIFQNGIAAVHVEPQLKLDSSAIKFSLAFDGAINLLSYNQGDYFLKGSGSFMLHSWQLKAALMQVHQKPEYVQQQFSFVPFEWSNAFDATTTSVFEATLQQNKIHASVTLQLFSVSNYVYWSSLGTPVQLSGAINGFVIGAEKNFTLHKFHLDNRIQFQQFSNDSVLSLPSFFSFHSLYFKSDLFKGAMTSRLGADVSYRTDYFAPGYLPATQQFYVQHETVLKFYPVIDVFVDAKIKSARIFFLVQYVSQGLFDAGYYSAIHYPMPSRSFKLGIDWMFWN